ncbi:hypothetical protein DFH11DRAFT_1246989 [Phellopilus nigrolimitatus]|nr:hypothetical protein DFH11DRAFT_1246989 [Phellopilus nigrolimitatus]
MQSDTLCKTNSRTVEEFMVDYHFPPPFSKRFQILGVKGMVTGFDEPGILVSRNFVSCYLSHLHTAHHCQRDKTGSLLATAGDNARITEQVALMAVLTLARQGLRNNELVAVMATAFGTNITKHLDLVPKTSTELATNPPRQTNSMLSLNSEKEATARCLSVPELIVCIGSKASSSCDLSSLSRCNRFFHQMLVRELVRDVQIALKDIASFKCFISAHPELTVSCEHLRLTRLEPAMKWTVGSTPLPFPTSLRKQFLYDPSTTRRSESLYQTLAEVFTMITSGDRPGYLKHFSMVARDTAENGFDNAQAPLRFWKDIMHSSGNLKELHFYIDNERFDKKIMRYFSSTEFPCLESFIYTTLRQNLKMTTSGSFWSSFPELRD